MYDFFLSKETFFTKNRWYLLVTSILSFVLPLIKIPTFQRVVPEEITFLLPEIVLSPQRVIEQTSIYQSIDYLDILFMTGLSIFFIIFLVKLYKLLQLIIKYKIEDKGSYKLIVLPGTKKAFSFLHYVFLGGDINENDKEKIIEHELIHSNQKHTYDLLFFELLKVIMWFNPLLYVYQKRIATIHEYISDASVVKSIPKETYINKLINELFDVENITFVNQFSKHSLIKKRIIMMTKKKSKEVKQAKYLLLIPVLMIMIFYTSFLSSAKANNLKFENTILKDIEELTRKDSNQIEIIDHFEKEAAIEKIEDPEIVEKKTAVKRLEAPEIIGRKIAINKLKDIAIIETRIDVRKSRDTVIEKKEIEDILFTIIDKVPTFPGCEEGSKNCFNKNVQRHFAVNFKGNLPKQLDLKPGKKRIVMLFKIDKQGEIKDIRVKAPHEKLKEECIRIIKMLPKMLPGEQDGKPVGVKYTLPMRIDVE
tara:strand:+ start:20936 stop:22372 length:1437 start_codon:yes stop_codon:yes gene_type:complete